MLNVPKHIMELHIMMLNVPKHTMKWHIMMLHVPKHIMKLQIMRSGFLWPNRVGLPQEMKFRCNNYEDGDVVAPNTL